jgi:hypothetical protein
MMGSTANTDASLHTEWSTTKASAGVIIWNSNGQVSLSACRRLPNCSDREEAEMCAILCELKELSKIYTGRLCVETDCAVVAALLKNSERGIWGTYLRNVVGERERESDRSAG